MTAGRPLSPAGWCFSRRAMAAPYEKPGRINRAAVAAGVRLVWLSARGGVIVDDFEVRITGFATSRTMPPRRSTACWSDGTGG